VARHRLYPSNDRQTERGQESVSEMRCVERP
jgi:hypothetical protein